MRVTCDGCGAKYAIADERVQGRSVRVKCKKCGASISVGTVTATGGGAADPGWMVLLDDGEQRPVTPEQLVALYRDGTVHDDSYLWKEGMDDWRPLTDLDEVKALLEALPEPGVEVTAVPVAEPTPGAGPVTADRARRAVSSPGVDLFGAAVPGARASGPASAEGGGTPRPGAAVSGVAAEETTRLAPLSVSSPRPGADSAPFSSRSAPSSLRAGEGAPFSSRPSTEGAPFSSRAGAGAGPVSSRAGVGPLSQRAAGDSLFGPGSGPGSRRAGAEGPPSSQGGPLSQRAARREDRVVSTLSGSRNDDSVLFSVATLAGSGAGKKSLSPEAKPSMTAPPAAGAASSDSEASGMIDMRILSTMHSKPPKQDERRDDRVDDLMNMGMSGPLFTPSLAAPSLASPLLAPPPTEAPPAPPPSVPMASAAEVVPASDVGAAGRTFESSGVTATAAGPRRGKVPRWALGAGAIGLGLLGVIGLSSALSSGPEKDAPAVVAVADTKVEGARAAQAPAAAPAAEAEAPKAAEPAAAVTATGGGEAAPAAEAPKGEADAAAPPEAAVAAAPKAEARRHEDDAAAKQRRREREEAERKEAEQRRAEQEKKAAESRAKAEAAAAAPAAAAGPAGTAPFDRGAASAALGSAAGGVGACKKADGPTGSGRVAVTFAPSGAATNAVVEGPPFAGTPVGGCIAAKFRAAKVPAFAGSAITVKKSFSIN